MTKPLITQKCVIYARVSSKEQEREGYSIPAQLKFLNAYANQNGFIVAKEFVDNETAKKSGRTNFGEMIKYLRKYTTNTGKQINEEVANKLVEGVLKSMTIPEEVLNLYLDKLKKKI